MRLFLALISLSLLVKTANGQTFFPTPAPLLEQELMPQLANECYILFENPAGDTLRLKWRKVEANFPTGWTIDLCDYGACYTGIPAQGRMNAVYDSLQPYLKLIVQPGATTGSGWLWFRVYEETNPDNFADVYFSLFTTGATAAAEPNQPGLKVFPNPATNDLFLENPADYSVQARIYNATGDLKWNNVLLPLTRTTLSLNNWPPGPYFLQTPVATRVILHTH